MKRLVLCVVVLVLSGVGPATGAPILWRVEDGGNGHWYEFVGQAVSWATARVAAGQRTPPIGYGIGHLATVSDAKENAFLAENFTRNALAWIGFTDEVLEGEWRWIDDTPGIWQDPDNFSNPIQTAFTNWWVGEPNNSYNEDYCILGWGLPDRWNDGTGLRLPTDPFPDSPFPYIVEYELPFNLIPEPASLLVWSLLGASGIGIGWWRRRRQVAWALGTGRPVG